MSDDSYPHYPEDDSEIPAITLPPGGFTSRIPPHLLAGKTESEQYMLNAVSRMDHFVEWAAPLLVDSNRQSRRTNGRVTNLEKVRDSWKSKKGMVVMLVGGVCALVGFFEGLATIISFFGGGGKP